MEEGIELIRLNLFDDRGEICRRSLRHVLPAWF